MSNLTDKAIKKLRKKYDIDEDVKTFCTCNTGLG